MNNFHCSDRFPYYKSNDDRWKNSVRHNLSINPHFRKGSKAAQGAGHLWTISTRDSESNVLAWEHVHNLFILNEFIKLKIWLKSWIFNNKKIYRRSNDSICSLKWKSLTRCPLAIKHNSHSTRNHNQTRQIKATFMMRRQSQQRIYHSSINNLLRSQINHTINKRYWLRF